MMNRIDATFVRLKRSGKKALIGYVTAGFPKKSGFVSLVQHLNTSGLDVLEIGVPFSDPVADGAVIQQSSQIALANGVTLDWILRTVALLRRTTQLPIVLMSYTNPILAMGLEKFFARAHHSGVDGLIIPDVTPEEGKPFEDAAGKHHLQIIYLAAPTTPPRRLKRIARSTRGFLYAVSLTGVTGERRGLAPGLTDFLRSIRRYTKKPVAVGFGISSPEQVRRLRHSADGIIVGLPCSATSRPHKKRRVRLLDLCSTRSIRKELNHATGKFITRQKAYSGRGLDQMRQMRTDHL
jgi:tryptophan synthase alpha chain